MGISSKKTTVGPSKFAQPFISDAAGTLQNAVRTNQPAVQANTDLLNQNIPGLAASAFGPNPTLDAGNAYASNVLGGTYLGAGNPYLTDMISQTNNDVQDRVNSEFGQAGRTGGTQHVQALGTNLANSENALRYSDYNGERDRMQAALGSLPGLAQARYAGIAPLLASMQSSAETPLLGAQALASGIGGLLGNYTTTKQSGSPLDEFLKFAQAASSFIPTGGK